MHILYTHRIVGYFIYDYYITMVFCSLHCIHALTMVASQFVIRTAKAAKAVL